MILDRVTITGADDRTDPDELVRLSRRYPFLEWGILIWEGEAGAPRHPSPAWRQRLAEITGVTPELRLSAHLEGALSRTAMLGGSDEFFTGSYHAGIFQRIQLNGFSSVAKIAPCAIVQRHPTHAFIFQVESEEAYAAAQRQGSSRDANIGVLFDKSAGKGETPDRWPEPRVDLYTGFAGGISPGKVDAVCATIRGYRFAPFWIDMEANVRTGDVLDLAKVERVLQEAQRWVR
jgi:phosphoribosylanthranilate isomerase